MADGVADGAAEELGLGVALGLGAALGFVLAVGDGLGEAVFFGAVEAGALTAIFTVRVAFFGRFVLTRTCAEVFWAFTSLRYWAFDSLSLTVFNFDRLIVNDFDELHEPPSLSLTLPLHVF